MMTLGILGLLGGMVCIIAAIISIAKKNRKAKYWGICIAVCFVLFIVGAVNSSPGDTSMSAKVSTDSINTASEANVTIESTKSQTEDAISVPILKETTPEIEFNNVIFENSFGSTMANGEVKNNGDQACSFTLKVSFYDKDGKLLGTAVGAVNDINGGSKKLFSAMGMNDFSSAASYKVQVDTMIDKYPNKENVIEFSNVIINNNSGLSTVEGEAKNLDTATHSFTVTVGLYDEAGKLIGVASGAMNDLAGGDTKTFTTLSTGDISKAKSYQAFVDTMVD